MEGVQLLHDVQGLLLGEPNGDIQENCVITRNVTNNYGQKTGWNDLSCDRSQCVVCNISTTPTFEMRGLCFGSQFDAHFGWTGEFSNDSMLYSFRGFSKSILKWNSNEHQWILSLYGNNQSRYSSIVLVMYKISKLESTFS